MHGILILLPAALPLGALFVARSVGAARAGQFDDREDPPQRMLRD